MPIVLGVHILAGALAILGGACAAFSAKGQRLHRAAGKVFVAAMVTMAILGGGLALAGPLPHGAAPPPASVGVAALSLYLVMTGLLATRRRSHARLADAASAFGALVAASLVAFGTHAALRGAAAPGFVPYFAFASLAGYATALDIRTRRAGAISAPKRITRHLWRMGAAWFFACASFFIGQQKVMPASLHGSPVLVLAAFLPLGVVAVWVVRIRLTVGSARTPEAPIAGLFALRPRTGRCAG